MQSLEAVVESLVDGEDRPQVRTIVGECEASTIAARWRALVREHLGVEVTGCTYGYVSVGITLELRLHDDRRCVLKACRDGGEELDEALRVQAHLARAGFPAPAVLMSPRSCAGAQVVLIEALDRGEAVRYGPGVRDTMAREYARLLELAAGVTPRPVVPDRGPRLDRLWPTPHSAIFDFEATRSTAGPIDALARAAQQRLRAIEAEPVVAHCDWSLQNVAFRGGRLVGVFDWDSVFAVPEVVAVAGAAAFHQQDWRVGPEAAAHDFYPGPEAALAFADEYARARGRVWTGEERALLQAALVYALGYQARCQHALAPDEIWPARRRLVRFAEAFGLR